MIEQPFACPQPLDINLFAGGGGLAVGLKLAGFAPTELYELDKQACETLLENANNGAGTLSGCVHTEDVEQVEWPKNCGPVRLLAAGVPCQPFSLAGKHLAEHDGRNLFPEVFRAIRALQPAAVLLENVRGLLRDSFQRYFEYILRQLECPSIAPRPNELWQSHNERIRRYQCSPGYEPEYHVTWRLLDAADFGVPQNRFRVFIMATRPDVPIYRFPQATHSRSALLNTQHSNGYWKRHGIRKPKTLPGDGASLELDDGRLPWVTVRDALVGLPAPARSEKEAEINHWRIPGARAYRGHDGSVLDWPSKTIKAGVHGVPGGENTLVDDRGEVRYYTFREAARIQAFPDEHIFKGLRIHITRQIGNAVPSSLAASIARPLFTLLGGKMTDRREGKSK